MLRHRVHSPRNILLAYEAKPVCHANQLLVPMRLLGTQLRQQQVLSLFRSNAALEILRSRILDLANDYSVNAGVFRDSGNFVKEYANLCSATALYLLALQSEQLDRDQRQELITKCESYIKLQEEIEHTRFSVDELIATDSPSKKKRKKKTAETSL